MILAADEIARSLNGSWDLLNRRAQGLKQFEIGEASFWRSFGAPLLAAPAFVVSLAADRVHAGLFEPGSLFDNASVVARAGFDFAALWLTLPLLGIALANSLHLRAGLVPFIIVCNWSCVLAAAILSVPALMLAIGWATAALATLYSVAAIVIIMQMRWFSAKITLGVTSGVALVLAACDGLVGLGLLRVLT
ncbi:MAG: hypothetical protein JWM36_2304 [Hyphomicrobiales bacterium]|nr:hypothetical protein [Hyphomicrobiales bacterium]